MKTKTETKDRSGGLKLTEQQVADFTRLAELQKAGDANGKDRKLITDAYRAFAIDNHDALAAGDGSPHPRRPMTKPETPHGENETPHGGKP